MIRDIKFYVFYVFQVVFSVIKYFFTRNEPQKSSLFYFKLFDIPRSDCLADWQRDDAEWPAYSRANNDDDDQSDT